MVQLNMRRVCVFCVAILAGSGCGTTTQRIGASEAAMENFGVSPGDVVLVRYVNENDPRSSSSSEWVKLTEITATGISAVAENGRTIDTPFDEIFEIERKQGRRKELREMPALESAIRASGRLLILSFAIAGAKQPAP